MLDLDTSEEVRIQVGEVGGCSRTMHVSIWPCVAIWLTWILGFHCRLSGLFPLWEWTMYMWGRAWGIRNRRLEFLPGIACARGCNWYGVEPRWPVGRLLNTIKCVIWRQGRLSREIVAGEASGEEMNTPKVGACLQVWNMEAYSGPFCEAEGMAIFISCSTSLTCWDTACALWGGGVSPFLWHLSWLLFSESYRGFNLAPVGMNQVVGLVDFI